jgi:endonuclease/exonuclease/phosphatase family metal-dependent hydrolase
MKWLKRLLFVLLVTVAAFGLLLGWATLADYKPPVSIPAETTGIAPEIGLNDSIFSIKTWNIGYFGLGKECDFFFDGGKMTRPQKADYQRYSEAALKYLAQADKPDFFFFQEVDIYARRSYFDDQVTRLRNVFKDMESASVLNYVVPFVPVPVTNPMGKVNSGLVSFSAFKTTENTRYTFPTSYPWPVGLFQLDRCFMLSRVPLPGGKELVLINTHNEAFDDGSQRNKQMAVLKEMMFAEYAKGNYVIVGGDWNQNPVGFGDWAIGRLDDLAIWRFGDLDVGRTIEPAIEADFLPQEWQWVFDPEFPTNRDVDTPYERGKTKTTIIDFFVASPNVKVLEINTEDLGFEWCDHQPVEMVFRLGNEHLSRTFL